MILKRSKKNSEMSEVFWSIQNEPCSVDSLNDSNNVEINVVWLEELCVLLRLSLIKCVSKTDKSVELKISFLQSSSNCITNLLKNIERNSEEQNGLE